MGHREQSELLNVIAVRTMEAVEKTTGPDNKWNNEKAA